VTGTVLVLDDSLTVRMDLVDAFAASGFTVIPCASIACARERLARGPVDVVILDVMLPDGDGVELLREIRSHPLSGSAVVLMLSTEAEVNDRVRALEKGADEYVGKPYDTSYVVARAGELLRARIAPSRDLDNTSPTILVIDDSLTFREELRTVLLDAGYQVLTAGTGEEGLRVAGETRPDAMVIDGVLPDGDGAAVIKRVRLDVALRDVPCLLLTASDDRGAELTALDAGADLFVRKEGDLTVVLAKIAALLRRRAPAPVRSRDASSLTATRKILAVDDSPTYLNEVSSKLRDEGYDVILARTGEEALAMMAVQAVDCVLLDLVMPGWGGEETCQRIKSSPNGGDVPIIMLTSLDDRDAMIGAFSAGADDYVQKSSEFKVLTARVRAQLRRRQYEDENRRIREELLQSEIEATKARAAQELAATRAALVRDLERKNAELDAFCYSVSHDLRAPARRIEGFSHALLEDFGATLVPEGREYVERIRSSAVRMSELIDDLLELSRLDRTELHMAAIDLAEMARSIVADLAHRDPERVVEFDVAAQLPAIADGRLMQAALENLIGNAWKFTAKLARARIELGQVLQGNEKRYFVRDNGVGFDMKYSSSLFNPFQRLHDESDFPGTGIGLATVHRIISKHGGRVWADAAADAGATFFFTIPPQTSSR